MQGSDQTAMAVRLYCMSIINIPMMTNCVPCVSCDMIYYVGTFDMGKHVHVHACVPPLD